MHKLIFLSEQWRFGIEKGASSVVERWCNWFNAF